MSAPTIQPHKLYIHNLLQIFGFKRALSSHTLLPHLLREREKERERERETYTAQ